MATDGTASPRISVIIPALNAGGMIADQLEALARQEWPGAWEVIVADNGSTDETVSVAETFGERFLSLRVVDASRIRGSAHARNAGARIAAGGLFLFCDADDIVAEGWLAAMADALEEHAVVAPRFDFHALNPGHLSDSRGDPQAEGVQCLEYPPYLAHAGGSGLGIRKQLFELLGGFDESLRYGEDTDLCVRAQLAGFVLAFAPSATVRVRLPRSGRRQFWQGYRWAIHNTSMYLRYRPEGHRLIRPWYHYGREVRRVLATARRVTHASKRSGWIFRAAWDLGLLSAAIHYRTPPMTAASVRGPEAKRPGTGKLTASGADVRS